MNETLEKVTLSQLIEVSPPDHLKIAAIIPAFNEANGIESVLEVLHQTDFVSEIIVVDDGSKDSTADKVINVMQKDARIRLIRHHQNLGKGQAIFTGRKVTQAPLLLIIDADLIGLTPDHLYSLAKPVIQGKASMTRGLFKGGRFLTDFSHWGAPFLTGQRCVLSKILDEVNLEAASGYGFETTLTVLTKRSGYRTMDVYLHGVWHPPSELHRGILHGIWCRFRMYAQIVRAWLLTSDLPVLWVKVRNWIRPNRDLWKRNKSKVPLRLHKPKHHPKWRQM